MRRAGSEPKYGCGIRFTPIQPSGIRTQIWMRHPLHSHSTKRDPNPNMDVATASLPLSQAGRGRCGLSAQAALVRAYGGRVIATARPPHPPANQAHGIRIALDLFRRHGMGFGPMGSGPMGSGGQSSHYDFLLLARADIKLLSSPIAWGCGASADKVSMALLTMALLTAAPLQIRLAWRCLLWHSLPRRLCR